MPGNVLLDFCLLKFDQMVQIVSELDDEVACRRPDLPGANSAYVLLTHCLGMMRWWSSNACRGIDLPRDRAAEFTASGSVQDLLARAARVREGFIADVQAVNPQAAPVAPRDQDCFWQVNNAGIHLHIFEELCQHLGHLEMTRDLVRTS